ncbi:MAG: FecR family protein [Candidatus Ozemobacteraceae bacterium]
MSIRDECDQFIEILTDPAKETSALVAHLRQCKMCRETRQAILRAMQEGPQPGTRDLTHLKGKVVAEFLRRKTKRPQPAPWNFNFWIPSMGAAFLIVLSITYHFFYFSPNGPDISNPRAACIVRNPNGQAVTVSFARPFVLATETASVQTPDGTVIDLSGPAVVEFSRRGLFLESGKALIRVSHNPEAYRAITPHGTVTDIGTIFSLEVSPGQTSITVLDGSVRLVPLLGSPSVLIAGQSGVMLKSSGETSTTSAFHSPFQGSKHD